MNEFVCSIKVCLRPMIATLRKQLVAGTFMLSSWHFLMRSPRSQHTSSWHFLTCSPLLCKRPGVSYWLQWGDNWTLQSMLNAYGVLAKASIVGPQRLVAGTLMLSSWHFVARSPRHSMQVPGISWLARFARLYFVKDQVSAIGFNEGTIGHFRACLTHMAPWSTLCENDWLQAL